MNNMKYIFILPIILLNVCAMSYADTLEPDMQYRRSSLCSFLVSRADQDMHTRIETKYLEIPTPDQYNDHNLSVRMLTVDKKQENAQNIEDWLTRNQIASRLVSRWFDRNILDGSCTLDVVKERGLYNATELDKELAARSARGLNMLADAGDMLIGNTFVLVHETSYIDHGKRSKIGGGIIKGLGLVASIVTGSSAISDLADDLGDIVESIKGFGVKFHTSLYQLVWDEDTQHNFYANYYSDKPDSLKRELFEQHRDDFKLKYIGDVTSSGTKCSFLGISEEEPEQMIRKACQRAIDDNVRDLQAKFDVFRVKSPIKAIRNGEVDVAIGMKEGLNEESEYELLEPQEKDGRIIYKHVGTIKPVKGKIWDNRYMAKEEGAAGSYLTASTFKVSSGKPYEGLLVRQVK